MFLVDSKESLAAGSSVSSSSPTPSVAATNAAFYSLDYYKGYFDFPTEVILSRLYRSIAPTSTPFYIDDSQPDLYGPFWITTTLILFVAVCSNLYDYIEYDEAAHTTVDGNGDTVVEKWRYDFNTVTVATSICYSCITWIPVILYFFLQRTDAGKPLIELISIIGYSFTPLLITCWLLVIPVNILQWLIVSAGCAVQSWFVVKNVWTDRSNVKVFPIIVCLLAGYTGLALLFKWYFF